MEVTLKDPLAIPYLSLYISFNPCFNGSDSKSDPCKGR